MFFLLQHGEQAAHAAEAAHGAERRRNTPSMCPILAQMVKPLFGQWAYDFRDEVHLSEVEMAAGEIWLDARISVRRVYA
jgi:hypothetical protein